MNLDDPYFIVNPTADTGRLDKKWLNYQPVLEDLMDSKLNVGFTE